MSARISVVINTLNEEDNLPFALRSVKTWADEIVVVDMHSVDRSVEIAREFGAKVYLHGGPGFNYAPREYAIAQASEAWIFVLDADELVPVALSKSLREIASSDAADLVMVPRLNYLLGVPIRHTRWGPNQDMQLRFFKKGMVLASSIAHRDFRPKAGAKVLRIAFDGQNAIVHFNYLDSADFIERLNRYTSIEAQQALERGERSNRIKAIVHSILEFGNRFVRGQGYRDGWRGFYLSLFMMFYRISVYAKLAEREATGGREEIHLAYREEAEQLLRNYEVETKA